MRSLRCLRPAALPLHAGHGPAFGVKIVLMADVTLHKARAAKAAALRRCKGIGQVVGVGITRVEGEYAVKINLSEPLPPGVKVPAHIDGVAICLEVTGPLHPRGASE